MEKEAERIAEFVKISKDNFINSITNNSSLINEYMVDYKNADTYYGNIVIPTRATSGSAGYDFCIPFDLNILPGGSVTIPTGISCYIENNWVLSIYPRSGLGFKYRLRLSNTVGIIDSDYFYSDNEGHIMIKLVNEGNDIIKFKAGDRFAQGVFTQYGITVNDNVSNTRNGGFGSTDNK